MSQPILYLDVRTAEEFAERRLTGSINIPLDVLRLRLDELRPKHGPIVVYCRSGRRSALAAMMLREAGFSQIVDAGSLERAQTQGAAR